MSRFGREINRIRTATKAPLLKPSLTQKLALYLDLINLFLYMLELLRMLQGGDN